MNEPTTQPLDHLMLDLGRGVEFEDGRGKAFLLKLWEDVPWVCYRHASGRWVTLRPATQNDINHAAKQVSPRRA